LVKRGFKLAVCQIVGQRPNQSGALKAPQRPPDRRGRDPNPARYLARPCPRCKPQSNDLAHMAHSNPLCWHPSLLRNRRRSEAKQARELHTPSRMTAQRWARSFRSGGRDHPVPGGRHHSVLAGGTVRNQRTQVLVSLSRWCRVFLEASSHLQSGCLRFWSRQRVDLFFAQTSHCLQRHVTVLQLHHRYVPKQTAEKPATSWSTTGDANDPNCQVSRSNHLAESQNLQLTQ